MTGCIKGSSKLGVAPGSAQGKHGVLRIKLVLTTNKAKVLIPNLLIFILFLGGFGAHLIILRAYSQRVRSRAQETITDSSQETM